MPIYNGQHAKPLLDVPEARMYRTILRAGSRQRIDFAGHYVVVHWGCGTGCVSSAFLDVESGKSWFNDFALMCSEDCAETPWHYRRTSELLIVDPSWEVVSGEEESFEARRGPIYYRWHDGKLSELAASGDGGSQKNVQQLMTRFEANHPGVVRLGSNEEITPPKIVKHVEPKWPKGFRMKFDEFKPLMIEVVVSAETGDVTDARVLMASPRPELNQPALDSVLASKYRPARLHGKPVPVFMVITLMLHPQMD